MTFRESGRIIKPLEAAMPIIETMGVNKESPDGIVGVR